MSQAGPGVRPLDEAGHVGDHEALAAPAHHAQVGRERGEGVVGDLGARPGDAADQRGLAGVGVADDAHVGQQLQLELEVLLLPLCAGLREARRLVGGGGEVHVAEAAAAALADHEARAGLAHVGEDLAGGGVLHQRAGGHAQLERRLGEAVLVGAAAVLPAPGPVLADVAVVEQRVHLGVDDQDHVAAPAAVPAGRAAAGDELLPSPGHGAVSPVAGGDLDPDLVDELHMASIRRTPRARGLRGARDIRRRPSTQAFGRTLTTRRSPRVFSYFTVPSILANSV